MNRGRHDFYFLDLPETKLLFEIFRKGGIEARFVGGCVRDALIGKVTDDFDVAVNSEIENVKSLIESEGISCVSKWVKYGSVTVIIGSVKFEITSLRKDDECYGRGSKISSVTSFEEDAKRRDFTINALYVSETGELFDYFGGVLDILARRVIFIGDPKTRMEEDYLRILRYYRFCAKFEDVVDRYCDIVKEKAKKLCTLSIERIQKELFLILEENFNLKIFELIKKNGVFSEINIENYSKLLQMEKSPSVELKAYALFGYDLLMHKFKLSKSLKNKIKGLVK
ncbi:MAG: hypothetical protein LBI95_00465 [Holosporales bacterium]|nr:hypothetical protein [Holosporales bacterium]